MNREKPKDRIDGDSIHLHVPEDFKKGILKNLLVHVHDNDIKNYVIYKTSKGGILLQ